VVKGDAYSELLRPSNTLAYYNIDNSVWCWREERDWGKTDEHSAHLSRFFRMQDSISIVPTSNLETEKKRKIVGIRKRREKRFIQQLINWPTHTHILSLIKSKSASIKKKVFGVPLVECVTTGTLFGVPYVVERCIEFIQNRGKQYHAREREKGANTRHLCYTF
jgi:hypothetical protein